MPDGRMLKKAIVTSIKINGLSPEAIILFTWAIPFEDSAGFLEADPKTMKYTVVPMRENLSEDDVRGLIVEIIKSGAWEPYMANGGKRLVWDPMFEEHQKRRDKTKEAASRFAERETNPKTGTAVGPIKQFLANPIPLEDVERVWNMAGIKELSAYSETTQRVVTDQSQTTPPPLPDKSPPKESKEKKSKEKEKSEAKPLSVDELLDQDKELKDLVDRLRADKFSQVGGFIGKCLKELSVKNIPQFTKDLKTTLQIVEKKESFEGSVFAYAKETLMGVISENMSKRVEDQAEEYKKDEAKGPEEVSKILSKMQGE